MVVVGVGGWFFLCLVAVFVSPVHDVGGFVGVAEEQCGQFPIGFFDHGEGDSRVAVEGLYLFWGRTGVEGEMLVVWEVVPVIFCEVDPVGEVGFDAAGEVLEVSCHGVGEYGEGGAGEGEFLHGAGVNLSRALAACRASRATVGTWAGWMKTTSSVIPVSGLNHL